MRPLQTRFRERRGAVALAGLAAWLAVWSAAPRASRPPAATLEYPLRGVCWEGVGPIGPETLDPLPGLGVEWISQTPFGWVRGVDEPHVRLASGPHRLWGESDAGLAATGRWARARGLRTLLKPHLWVRGGRWVGEIAMRHEADWRTFFNDYEAFALHYARLAQREGFEAYAVGTELRRASGRSADWRRLIARVRRIYSGPLTYCAAWNEAEGIEFWDALDFVGVQAYYPLTPAAPPDAPAPSEDELRAAWQAVGARLERLAQRSGRRVVFTEVGFKSLRGTLRAPWLWDTRGEIDSEVQRRTFDALYASLWGRPWFGGTFVWKWHPRLGLGRPLPERYARDFTPQGKPALDSIARAYRAPLPAAEAPR